MTDALAPVPLLEEVVLLVSELCTNAILHSASGEGGSFEVTVAQGRSRVRVEVRDDGSDQIPVPSPPGASAEDGRGLDLVALMADQWGYLGDRSSRRVYFELGWDTTDERGPLEEAGPG